MMNNVPADRKQLSDAIKRCSTIDLMYLREKFYKGCL